MILSFQPATAICLQRDEDKSWQLNWMIRPELLAEIPNAISRVMLVVHNPDLEELVEYFVPDIQVPPDGKLVPTATLVHLQLDQQWDSIRDIKNVVSCTIQRPRDLQTLI